MAALCAALLGLLGLSGDTPQPQPQPAPQPQSPPAPSPIPDDQSITLFHYTSLRSAQAIAAGTYNAAKEGNDGYGMYLTNYDHTSGYQGYQLRKEELQFGLRSLPNWPHQPVDGYVKLRIPFRELKPGRLSPTFYAMVKVGSGFPDISEAERQAYQQIRKKFLFYLLPTAGGGRTPGSIDIKRFVIEYGPTQFR